ncbi:MAG: hypothetical protein RLZZ598_1206 [Pseudomonadota bacterium]
MIVKKVKNPKKSSSKAARIGNLAEYIRDAARKDSTEKTIYTEARGFLAETPEGQTAEMLALEQEAVKSKDPINHYVLSWQEGEQPTPAQVEEAVTIFLDELGLKGKRPANYIFPRQSRARMIAPEQSNRGGVQHGTTATYARAVARTG